MQLRTQILSCLSKNVIVLLGVVLILCGGCAGEQENGSTTGSFYSSSDAPRVSTGSSDSASMSERFDSSEAPSVSDAEGEMAFDESFESDVGDTSGNGGQARTLTAGNWDDNAYPTHYQRYASESRDTELSDLPTDRQLIKVVTRDGRPIRGAEVIVHSNQASTRLKTIDDGRALYAPTLDGVADEYRVQVSYRGIDVDQIFERDDTHQEEWEVIIDTETPTLAQALEVALIIDATGSMGDEISFIKAEFAGIINELRAFYPDLDIRMALTHYRDIGDQYVTQSHDFTGDLDEIQEALNRISAEGGGDFPEALAEAMNESMNLQWSDDPNVTRIAFIAADAPPHRDRQVRADHAAKLARSKGIRIFPIASSGINTSAEWVLRQAAAFTLGQYLFLTDDSGVGNPHAEPHIPCYEVRLLHTLIRHVIQSGIEGHWVDYQSDDIIRSSGFDENGHCVGVSDESNE